MKSLPFRPKLEPNTIISYVCENGDRPFAELSFNEVDSLVLSTLAYMNFAATPFADRRDFKCSMTELESLVHADVLGGDMWDKSGGRRLMKLAAFGRRFGDLLLHDYEAKTDFDVGKQFMAITFSLTMAADPVLYIAFRGTDDTFAGWKEDFELSFSRTLPSQIEAVAYVRRMAESYPGSQLILGGHSKGGNLAIYAALKSGESVRSRIAAVYDHDGPGFLPGTFADGERQAMVGIIHKSIPESSVVGMLLEEQYNGYSVVKSRAHAIYQHDPLSWLVSGHNFDVVERVNDLSKYTNKVINDWLQKVGPARRRQFIDALFGVLASTGVDNFAELRRYLVQNPRQAYNWLRNVDPEMRSVISQTLKELVSVSAAVAKSYAVDRISRVAGRPER